MAEHHKESIFTAIEQLQTLTHLFLKKRAALAKQVGLTEAQWRVLEEIQQVDFMPSMFAAKREYSKAAVSKLLRQLQEKKLIRLISDASDGRIRKYALTGSGEAALKALRLIREQAIEEIWVPLDSELLKKTIAFNQTLIDKLRQSLET